MVLLHAVHRALTALSAHVEKPSVTVVTFDHGTGAAATAAAALVAEEASARGLPQTTSATEAGWRDARWSFVRSVTPPGAVVATAHTWDDHLETVVMRVLRNAGARGLAGLAAATPGLTRPFLEVRRSAIARYASDHAVPFIDDPSNQSRRHFRNRVRLDLLPAIRTLRPGFEADMSAVAARAAELRRDVDSLVARHLRVDAKSGWLRVARENLATDGWWARSSRNSSSGTVYHCRHSRFTHPVVGWRRGVSASGCVWRRVRFASRRGSLGA